jgi:hypothetical protein
VNEPTQPAQAVAETTTPAPARTSQPAAGATPSAADLLNARLHGLGSTDPQTMKHYGDGIGDLAARAVGEAEAELAPPIEILAKTFGLIRVRRTALVADSIAYVYEVRETPFGKRCVAWRITDHPRPEAPERFDPNRPVASRNRPLTAVVEKRVDVSCNDPRIQRVVPGTLQTPVPRHG